MTKVTNEDAIEANKWFELGMKSGSKNTVICINEQLELLRDFKPIKTKKQLIDYMQDFVGRLAKQARATEASETPDQEDEGEHKGHGG
jgi:hypothetical protein